MRIKGLVRVFNHARFQLQAGLKPEEVELFRKQVKTVVREVEEICRKHGVAPDQLPAPSRMAYLFLKEIDLDDLPVIRDGEPTRERPTFRIRNVVKIGDYFAERLWQQLGMLTTSPDARARLEQEMDNQVSAIERVCALHDKEPSILEAPSRQVYCWLKFLCSGDNLTLHLEALQCAKDVVGEHYPPLDRTVFVHLISLNALWRTRRYRNVILLKVNEGFQNAGRKVWRAIIQSAVSHRDLAATRLIGEYAESDDFSEVLSEIESFAALPARLPRGRAHDLDESFERVNTAYFGGRMPKPTLVWNCTPTVQKFGHYQPSRDTVMISVSLDDLKVPAHVIDFVMYHELLHKKHGVITVNERRLAHNPSFRAEERQFAKYNESRRYIDELALSQRGLSRLMRAGLDDTAA